MGIKATLDTTWTEKEQREVAFEIRAALENWTMVCDETRSRLQVLFDGAKFNTLPDEIKITLRAWWDVLKAARQSMKDNPDIDKVMAWRPPAE